MAYNTLAICVADELIFGRSKQPVRCGFDLTIGAGEVHPEVNFTLPAMLITAGTWNSVLAQYREIVSSVLARCTALKLSGVVLEFEHLPPMTETPEWGAEITAMLHGALKAAYEKHGLRSALRVTPTDMRDQAKPPVLRSGEPWERVRRSFELCIEAGADIVSIESVGGKEVHDAGLMYGDIQGIVLALGVLAPRDIAWLWDNITGMCAGTRAIPGGDTACGFANTAMQLAHQKMLPEVLAAVVRAMSAVRSLEAFEHGAVGPSKDCAYEGPVIKAITGCPISMEGKSASCAHFSPVGNIAAAMCDLWSNESVQNIRLLSGTAPAAYAELLAYDCRLMNASLRSNSPRTLRDWMVDSDEWLSPQAAVLSPQATIEIAEAIVKAGTPLARTLAAGQAATRILRRGIDSNRLVLTAKERQWLDRIESSLEEISAEDAALIESTRDAYSALYDPASYGLS